MHSSILFITSKSLGGSGRHISTLVRSLRSHGYECDLLYYPTGVDQDKELEACFHRVHTFPRPPSMSPIAVIANVMRVRSILGQRTYHCVHTHTSLGGFIGRIGARSAKENPYVIHTIHAFGADQYTPIPQKWIYWVVERSLDFLTDRYVAPSQFIADYGFRTRLFKREKVKVIYNSLDLGGYKKSTSERMQNKVRLKLGEEYVYLFCGRLERQKGVDILIRALALLPANFACKLLICGSGSLEDSLRRLATDLGVSQKIVWIGWQSSLAPFYAAADAFVMPSRWESFGLVFLEAMSFGLPILSTTTQAIPEVVVHNRTGLLSENEDVESLAHNMKLIACDDALAHRLGAEGRKRLNENFLLETFVCSHIELYENAKNV